MLKLKSIQPNLQSHLQLQYEKSFLVVTFHGWQTRLSGQRNEVFWVHPHTKTEDFTEFDLRLHHCAETEIVGTVRNIGNAAGGDAVLMIGHNFVDVVIGEVTSDAQKKEIAQRSCIECAQPRLELR